LAIGRRLRSQPRGRQSERKKVDYDHNGKVGEHRYPDLWKKFSPEEKRREREVIPFPEKGKGGLLCLHLKRTFKFLSKTLLLEESKSVFQKTPIAGQKGRGAREKESSKRPESRDHRRGQSNLGGIEKGGLFFREATGGSSLRKTPPERCILHGKENLQLGKNFLSE